MTPLEQKIVAFALVFFIGALCGYVLKDQLTDEYKSEVSIKKAKIKGDGSNLQLDQVVEVGIKKQPKKGLFKRIRNKLRPSK